MKQLTDEELDRYITQVFALVDSNTDNRLFWGTRSGYEEFLRALQQLAKKQGWDKPTNTKGKQ